MPVIKRYANRKLYDTRAKRYITLDELADLVRRGDEVRVVDHASSEDITALTLAQIILAQEKKEGGNLSQVAFKAMIQASNQALVTLREALPWPADGEAQVNAEIERRIAVLVERGDLTEENGERLNVQLAAAGEHMTAELDAAAFERGLRARGVPTQAEVQALAQRLDELAAELDQLASPLSSAEP